MFYLYYKWVRLVRGGGVDFECKKKGNQVLSFVGFCGSWVFKGFLVK